MIINTHMTQCNDTDTIDTLIHSKSRAEVIRSTQLLHDTASIAHLPNSFVSAVTAVKLANSNATQTTEPENIIIAYKLMADWQ